MKFQTYKSHAMSSLTPVVSKRQSSAIPDLTSSNATVYYMNVTAQQKHLVTTFNSQTKDLFIPSESWFACLRNSLELT